ncbi:hypothetical protein A2U01_0100178, partial [Trifolium medium]|nr:hypothetical protein [Trifolium medium]
VVAGQRPVNVGPPAPARWPKVAGPNFPATCGGWWRSGGGPVVVRWWSGGTN